MTKSILKKAQNLTQGPPVHLVGTVICNRLHGGAALAEQFDKLVRRIIIVI